MASTNEDAVVLAAARFDDGRVLMVRHLPDRNTVELGWWRRGEGGAVEQGPPFLELAAEAVEVNAFAHLCERVAGTGWDTTADGGEIATAGPFGDGARLVGSRSGDEVTFVRLPEGDDLIRLPRNVLERLVAELLPAARQRIAKLGFGLVQQSAPAPGGPNAGAVRHG